MSDFRIVKCFESFNCFCGKEIKKDSFYMNFEDNNYCPVCALFLISIRCLDCSPIPTKCVYKNGVLCDD